MGLLPSMLHLLVKQEAKRGTFRGNMLTLGQQIVCATYDEVEEMILKSLHCNYLHSFYRFLQTPMILCANRGG